MITPLIAAFPPSCAVDTCADQHPRSRVLIGGKRWTSSCRRPGTIAPEVIVTDGLASYPAALENVGLLHLYWPGRLRENNRAENIHLPIRRRFRGEAMRAWELALI